MSNDVTATVEELKPQAASIEQIEAACPGAPDSFVLSQIKRGATLEQASNAWLVQQANDAKAQAATLAEENAKLKAEAEKAKAEQSTGADPIVSGGRSTTIEANDATSEWNARIAEKVSAGMSRQQAACAVARDNPALQEQVVAEANAKRKLAR